MAKREPKAKKPKKQEVSPLSESNSDTATPSSPPTESSTSQSSEPSKSSSTPPEKCFLNKRTGKIRPERLLPEGERSPVWVELLSTEAEDLEGMTLRQRRQWAEVNA